MKSFEHFLNVLFQTIIIKTITGDNLQMGEQNFQHEKYNKSKINDNLLNLLL